MLVLILIGLQWFGSSSVPAGLTNPEDPRTSALRATAKGSEQAGGETPRRKSPVSNSSESKSPNSNLPDDTRSRAEEAAARPARAPTNR